MPIVKPGSETEQVKVSLPNDVAATLTRYAEWASTTRSKTVTVALQRLFEQDTEWIEHIQEGD
jgi:metal-responsive CopG/Arc/MetJ family transcriptional regulator